jgi:hypothetical protein
MRVLSHTYISNILSVPIWRMGSSFMPQDMNACPYPVDLGLHYKLAYHHIITVTIKNILSVLFKPLNSFTLFKPWWDWLHLSEYTIRKVVILNQFLMWF